MKYGQKHNVKHVPHVSRNIIACVITSVRLSDLLVFIYKNVDNLMKFPRHWSRWSNILQCFHQHGHASSILKFCLSPNLGDCRKIQVEVWRLVIWRLVNWKKRYLTVITYFYNYMCIDGRATSGPKGVAFDCLWHVVSSIFYVGCLCVHRLIHESDHIFSFTARLVTTLWEYERRWNISQKFQKSKEAQFMLRFHNAKIIVHTPGRLQLVNKYVLA